MNAFKSNEGYGIISKGSSAPALCRDFSNIISCAEPKHSTFKCIDLSNDRNHVERIIMSDHYSMNINLKESKQDNDSCNVKPSNKSLLSEKLNFKTTIIIPQRPSIVLKTNILCEGSFENIYGSIDTFLSQNKDISSEFDSETCKWSVLKVSFCEFCQINIHIYIDDSTEDSHSYIVEAQLASGDRSVFSPLFRELKLALATFISYGNESVTAKKCGALRNSLSSVDSMRYDHMKINMNENLLEHLIVMVSHVTIEAQIEGLGVLCSLSYWDENIQYFRHQRTIQLLCDKMYSDREEIRRLAATTLFNISESYHCQVGIISSGVIPQLLEMCVDGDYLSRYTSRVCGRILSRISCHHGALIVATVGAAIIRQWLKSKKNLPVIDSQLKAHVDRICVAFNETHLV